MKIFVTKKHLLFLLGILALVFFSGLLLYIRWRSVPEITSKDFMLSEITSGKMLSFQSLQGQHRMVWFFASWCGPCRGEIAQLERIKQQIGQSALIRYIAISDEPTHKILSFKNHTGSTFEFYQSQQKLKHLGISSFPTIFIIDQNNEIVFSARGPIKWNSSALKKTLLHDKLN